MEKILTTPSATLNYTVNYVTGNHHLSLPQIDEQGNIKVVSVLKMSTKSLLELRGEPLLSPTLVINGDKQHFFNLQGEYSNYFIPSFTKSNSDYLYESKIYAPEGFSGFVYEIKLSAKNAFEANVGLCLNDHFATKTIFHTYPLVPKINTFIYKWTNCILSEVSSDTPMLALAISGNGNYLLSEDEGAYTCSHSTTLNAGETKTFYYYVSVGDETDGAALNNMDMRRRGGENLLSLTQNRLSELNKTFADKAIEKLYNINQNFCYYFSAGYTIDTDELVLVTSKSHRYYVSAAFWSRDTLLWAFPTYLNADASFAKQVLKTVFTRYIKNAKIHALYIDGKVLYPAFELDELVAPLIALERFCTYTNDFTLLKEADFIKGIKDTIIELAKWKDQTTMLFATELDPSDDPHENKLLTYNNVLVLKSLKFIDSLISLGHFSIDDFPFDIKAEINSLHMAITKNCIVKTSNCNVFAYSISGKNASLASTPSSQKAYCLYDNPPGSLLLLPYYGFCDCNDEVYKNTVNFIFSKNNEYFYENGNLFGTGCEHVKYPWSKSLCNYLLSNGYDERFISAIKSLTMDNFIASESFDVNTGKAITGEAFATYAGFFANALLTTCKN